VYVESEKEEANVEVVNGDTGRAGGGTGAAAVDLGQAEVTA
jgi:hypothetical protein